MVKAIKENENGRSAEEISRELGINKATFYNWRKKYAGMEASQLKRLKENRKLKQMYADLSLDNVMLEDVIAKKVVELSAKKEIVIYLRTHYKISIERSCKVIEFHRSMWYYRSKKDDSEVIEKLNQLAESHPTRGFDEYFGRIRQQGLKWNRKRVLRVYRAMKLGLRRQIKKRLPARTKQPLVQPISLNQTWSMPACRQTGIS